MNTEKLFNKLKIDINNLIDERNNLMRQIIKLQEQSQEIDNKIIRLKSIYIIKEDLEQYLTDFTDFTDTSKEPS